MARDTVFTEPLSDIVPTSATDWETIQSFKLRRDTYETLYLWGQIRRDSGSGTIYLRFQLTDGTNTYSSAALTSTSTDWDSVGSTTIDMTVVADQIWTCNIQAKVDSGSTMSTRGLVVQRVV